MLTTSPFPLPPSPPFPSPHWGPRWARVREQWSLGRAQLFSFPPWARGLDGSSSEDEGVRPCAGGFFFFFFFFPSSPPFLALASFMPRKSHRTGGRATSWSKAGKSFLFFFPPPPLPPSRIMAGHGPHILLVEGCACSRFFFLSFAHGPATLIVARRIIRKNGASILAFSSPPAYAPSWFGKKAPPPLPPFFFPFFPSLYVCARRRRPISAAKKRRNSNSGENPFFSQEGPAGALKPPFHGQMVGLYGCHDHIPPPVTLPRRRTRLFCGGAGAAWFAAIGRPPTMFFFPLFFFPPLFPSLCRRGPLGKRRKEADGADVPGKLILGAPLRFPFLSSFFPPPPFPPG